MDLGRGLSKVLGYVEEGREDLGVLAWTFSEAKLGWEGRGLGVEAPSWEGGSIKGVGWKEARKSLA